MVNSSGDNSSPFHLVLPNDPHSSVNNGAILKALYPLEIAICSISFIFNLVTLFTLHHTKNLMDQFRLSLQLVTLGDLVFVTVDLFYSVTIVQYGDIVEAVQPQNLGCADEALNDLSRHLLLLPLLSTTSVVIVQSLSIVKPLQFNSIVTKRRVLFGMALAVGFVALSYITLHVVFLVGNMERTCLEHFYGGYTRVSALYLGTACTAIEIVNLIVYAVFWHKARVTLTTGMASNTHQHFRRLQVTVGLLMGTILLFWTPAVVMLFLMVLMYDNPADISRDATIAHQSVGVVALLNPLMDPLIYVLRISEVKGGYRRLWKKMTNSCQPKPKLDQNSETISDKMKTKDQGSEDSYNTYL
ncbi:olfactory receptor 140-like [Lingula anatina]|uniref:Olfactory receptor 140-like n=1 Tax=Lingula anatina TaxID=7574 RepID=A0A1S3JW46_LINAN|nr:olfactory receptor 140-like [Lingula anatina]|eukprot:XP_013414645.1 olfactory receptor 140-like [Lingula anatina]